jgi:hypothetical protein
VRAAHGLQDLADIVHDLFALRIAGLRRRPSPALP